MKRMESLGANSTNALENKKRSILGDLPNLLKIKLISAEQFEQEIGKLTLLSKELIFKINI